jgi:acyl carrier protein
MRNFLQENFLYMHSSLKLADDDRLLERGVIDSMSILEMIGFIVREFGLEPVEAEDISEANFGSLAGIARYVSERQSDAAASAIGRAVLDVFSDAMQSTQ